MFAPDYPVLTERLALRPLTVADAAALARYQSREDVTRYIPYQPRGEAELRERLSDPDKRRSTLEKAGTGLALAVVRREDDVLIGDLMLMWLSDVDRSGEIGYVFDPRWQGNGYATEAGEALLRLGFEGLGLHRIMARVDARNEASARVLQRLGMRQEAHLRENEWFKGEWTDEFDFAILETEWRARQ